MMPRASFRLFRTGLIGSVVLGLAVGGHLTGGGQVPGLFVLVALCGVTMVQVAALTRFRLSFPVLTGLIGTGQLWFHWALNVLSLGSPSAVPPALLAGHASHGTMHVGHETFAVTVPTHVAAPGALMFVCHVVATFATALLLARGERTLGILAGWFEPLFGRAQPATFLPGRIPGPCFMATVFPASRSGRRLPSRRGPPALAAA